MNAVVTLEQQEAARHSLFSPSAAHRWMRCPGSVVLHSQHDDTAGRHAMEGTLAHAVAEWALTKGIDRVRDYLDHHPGGAHLVDGVDEDIRVTEEMCDYVQVYVDYCQREAGADSEAVVESRVSFAETLGVTGEASGTADFVVLRDDSFTVVDLKYGRGVQVFAEDNEQLMLYALGVVEQYGHLADFQRAKLVIVQPRLDHIDEFEVDMAELSAFAEDAKQAAAQMEVALVAAEVADYLNPGEKQCRWCNAQATCPALRAEVAAVTGADFDDLLQGLDDLSVPADADIGVSMSKIDLIESWCKAVRAECERQLLAGQTVPGWKLVQGRKGARQWTSAEEAEALLKKFRLKVEQMYDLKVISPTTAEKLLADSPRRWKQAQALIVQREGSPSVAPESDKRPALSVAPSADGMDIITEDN